MRLPIPEVAHIENGDMVTLTLIQGVDEVISEIELRSLPGVTCATATDADSPPNRRAGGVHVAQVKESEAVTEKRLDVSGHRSLHSL